MLSQYEQDRRKLINGKEPLTEVTEDIQLELNRLIQKVRYGEELTDSEKYFVNSVNFLGKLIK